MLFPRKSHSFWCAAWMLLSAGPAGAQVSTSTSASSTSLVTVDSSIPLPAPVVPGGVYYGLLRGETLATSGYVRAVLSAGRRGSVAVVLGNEKPCVLPVGVAPGGSQVIALPGGEADMQIDLYLVVRPDGTVVLAGKVIDDGHEIAVTAPKVVPRTVTVGRPAGRYTFVLGSAGTAEAGCGSVQIARNGTVRGAVRLTDGRALPVSGNLNATGSWLFYVGTAASGSLSGAVTVAETGALAGTLDLRVPATETQAERTTAVNLSGSLYQAESGFVARRARQAFHAEVTGQPNGAADFIQHGHFTNDDLLLPQDAESRGLRLALWRESGWIVGRTKTAAGAGYVLRGVVLSAQDAVRGFFVEPQGGTFAIAGVVANLTGSTGGVTITGSGTLILTGSNAGGLVKTGAGTLTLTGSDTYTGGGVLETGALNGGTTVLNSGTLNLGGLGGLTAPGTLTYAGNVVITGNNTINLGNNILGIGTLVIQTPTGTHGLPLTDPAGNPITFDVLNDGDYVLIGTRRYLVTQATTGGALTLTFTPLPPPTP